MKFSELDISPTVVRALDELEITEPTEIQEKSIPLMRQGKDVVGISRTGSGKTLSFCVPIIEHVKEGEGVQALVLAPTRELAMQISTEMVKFAKYTNFSIATVFGGVAIQPQMDKIRKSEVVVGTPGRILDHLSRGTLNLKGLKMFVLDEADKMVDMGFIEDINRILDQTNNEKQVILFGATISSEVENIKKRHMTDPETVKVKTQVHKDLLEQYYYNVKQHEKFSLLVHLIKTEETRKVIIFCSTKAGVNAVSRNLVKQGIKADMIHGDLSQNKRMKVVEQFNLGDLDIMVASPVAARGLDIKNVSHVINYDLAKDPQEYIHRIGRTARAGQSGKAITLLGDRDHDAFHSIKRKYDVHITLLFAENVPKLHFEMGSRYGSDRGSRRSGGYSSKGGSFSSRRSYSSSSSSSSSSSQPRERKWGASSGK
jgi:superfamily II DNA/RNA helicase